MKFEKTGFQGLFLIHTFNPRDNRGQFVKLYNDINYRENQINFNIEEVYYSISNKDVIRGMHFQIPPNDHNKIVFVSEGEITDVCLDLRKKSSTFGKVFSVKLSSANNVGIFIPKGFAHGFETLSDKATVHYLQSTVHSHEHDTGILWNSIPYEWLIDKPIVSERDKSFISLNEYITTNQNYF